MAELEKLIHFGLILSVVLVAGGLFYYDMSSQYGRSATELAALNKTQEIMENVETMHESLINKADDVSDYGIFLNAFRAIGSILNTLLDSIQFVITMIVEFNTIIGGNSLIAGYALTAIEAIILLAIALIVMRAILGGRI